MECKNKEIVIDGMIVAGNKIGMTDITAVITNDEIGKTLSLRAGDTQITVPFEPLEEYLK